MTSTRSNSSHTLFGIGYEGRTLYQVIDLLVSGSVEVVVDVRQTPISRKPGFSRRPLAEALSAAGIEYRLHTSLGNPKDNRDGFRDGVPAARRRYLAHIDTYGHQAFVEVVGLVRSRAVALLCFEQAAERCHRSCLSERIQVAAPGVSIITL